MAVAVWSYGKLRILALTDDPVTEGGQLPLPPSHRGLPALEGLRMALEAILGRGCRAIILDMERVTYLDSADLGELFSCRKRLLHLGADLALLHVSGRARSVVEMVDVNRVFRMFDEEAEALAALGG